MRILILTGEFGKGHVSVAKAIKENLSENYDEKDIVICDLIHNIFPHISCIIYMIFNWVAKKQHNLYNLFTELSDKPVNFFFKRFLMRKLSLLFKEHKPDLIISTVPIGAQYVSDYKSQYLDNIPLITYITDVSAQNEWISDNTNLYVVGSKLTKKELILKGISEDKIMVNGIPVQKKFKSVRREKKDTRKKVLIMGGGLGLIDSFDELIRGIDRHTHVKITVVTGNNKHLYNKITKKYPEIEVYKFSNEIDRLMSENDLLITKAGGITLFESIYSEIPMFITRPFFNQEISNARFVEEKQIGTVIWDDISDVQNEIGNLINDSHRFETIRENIRFLKTNLDQYDFDDILCKVGLKK